jgi:type I restriction enzyme S subunit
MSSGVEVRSAFELFDIEGGTQPPKSQFIYEPAPGFVRLLQIRDFETEGYETYIPDSPKWRRCSEEDTLIGRYGAAVGRICRGLSGAYNVALAKVVPRDGIDPEYLHYLLRSDAFQGPLLAGSGRSAQAGFNKSDLKSIKLPVIPFAQQQAAGRLLRPIDDKIELNRRMNATLEEQARAIFKDWFVEFGPTRAKAEGSAPYLVSDLWSLFPEVLDDDDQPSGWRQGTLADVADSPRRGISPADVAEDTPYIGLEHMPRRSIALSFWDGAGKVTSNKSVFKRGEFLFGKLRPYFHKVGFAPLDGICSTDIVVVVPRAPEWGAFTLACLSSDEFVNYTDQTSTGTKMPRTTWKTMGQYKVCRPSEQIATAFQSVVQPLLDRIGANISEARTLSQTRDLLLPKLMSGEIRLAEAEKAVEAVA